MQCCKSHMRFLKQYGLEMFGSGSVAEKKGVKQVEILDNLAVMLFQCPGKC